MMGRRCARYWIGLAGASVVVGCVVQTGPYGATPQQPIPATVDGGGSSTRVSAITPRTASSTATPRSELRPVAERELTQYRSLISGEDDRVVLDPKLVNATDNVFTRSYNSTVAALEAHSARYDSGAVLSSKLPCEVQIEDIFAERASEPIRKDEDDVQFARRKDGATSGLAMFRRAMGSEQGATRTDVRFAYGLFVTKFDNRGQPVAGIPRARSPFEQRVDAVDKGLCHAKFLLVVNDWWKRQRAELEAKRGAGEAAKDVETRKAVLARRFMPVRIECSESWRATTTKCGELPGLSDDEKGQCVDECKAAAEEGFRKAIDSAITACVADAKDGPRNCELTKPAGATIADDVVTKGIATCKSECATKVRDQKQQAAKDHQDCLSFCRDLKNGFCSMTERPKQAACIDRCVRTRCSGN